MSTLSAPAASADQPPERTTVSFRGVCYCLDLTACRRALGRLPGRTDVARMTGLARRRDLDVSTVQAFFAGRIPGLAHTLTILDELGLRPTAPSWRTRPRADESVSPFLMTIREAATSFGLSTRTIRRWLAKRMLTRHYRATDHRICVDWRELAALRQWRRVS